MKTELPNLLGAVIRDYFTDHLPRLRGTSPHTIHSYRDSIVLLLRFLARQRAIDYLEYDEIDAILKAINRTTPQGSRDYALLATMFNTGGRVQEIADLRV